jgi:hypothetical protein
MRISRPLLLALALCLTLAATFLAAPPPIQADRCGNEFYYYDDAAHTNLVGYEVYECNCFHSSWGVHTVYRDIEPLGC